MYRCHSSVLLLVVVLLFSVLLLATTSTAQQEQKQEQQRRRQEEEGGSTTHPHSRRHDRRPPRDRPNFISLFMDDLGYGDLGFTGHPTTSTPNLDLLAWKGKVLTTWYSGCAACTGSRIAYMTGRQWPRTGLSWVLGPVGNSGLPLEEITIAEQLKKQKRTKKTKQQQQVQQQRSPPAPGTRKLKSKQRQQDNINDENSKDDKAKDPPTTEKLLLSVSSKATTSSSGKHTDAHTRTDNNEHTPTETHVHGTGTGSGTKSNIPPPIDDDDDDEKEDKDGYATAIVGKWHLGQRPIYLPGNRGFDYYLGIPYSDDMGDGITTPCPPSEKDVNNNDDEEEKDQDDHYMYEKEHDNDTDGTTSSTISSSSSSSRLDDHDEMEKENDYTQDDISSTQNKDIDPAAHYLPLVYQEYNQTQILEQPLDFTTLSDKYTTFATNFVSQHQNQPFLLYVPFSHVHVTSQSQPERQYAGCQFQQNTTRSTPRGSFGNALAEADAMVGNIIQTLQELDLLENTLILFTSDNGPWLSRGLSAGSEGLFTGRYAGYYDTGKATTWEGGLRMPAFAYWKGQIEPHSRSSEIISSLDIFPTLSKLANIPLDPNRTYDGRDMTDILLHSTRSSIKNTPNKDNDSSSSSTYLDDDGGGEEGGGGGGGSTTGNGKSKHEFLFFYGTCHRQTQPYYTVTAVRHGPYKAHWCTGPGLAGGDNVTLIRVYDQLPLLFQIEHDPSESEPIVPGNIWPTDPTHYAAMERIVKAYAMELSTFSFGTVNPYPDGPGEGPGLYGVCCDRTKNCNCTTTMTTTTTAGSSSQHPLLLQTTWDGQVVDEKEEDNDDEVRIGILNIGTKRHHDRYHEVLGEEEPSPPQTRAQVMLQNVGL